MLRNRTTWVTSGDSSGAQVNSLCAGPSKEASGTRCALPSDGTVAGAGAFSTRTSPPSSTPGTTPSGPSSEIASSRSSTSTARFSSVVRSRRTSTSSTSAGGSVASADLAVEKVSRAPSQVSPVRCQTTASDSSRSTPSARVAR